MIAITARTPVAGVVGAPVAHSLSPLLHNAWLAAGAIDGVYVAFHPPKAGFETFVEGLRGGAIVGLNVTIPFKEQALLICDCASQAAERSGAANLLLFHPDGTVQGANTDGEGLLSAVADQAPGFTPRGGPALVIGAGGAARGAVAALIDAGAPQVRVVNRTAERALALAAEFPASVSAFGLSELDRAAEGAGLVVNATSIGLGDEAVLPLPWNRLAEAAVVMDMVYRPVKTGLLRAAESHGCRTVDGLQMLIRQAAPSFEAFYGAPPPPLDARGLLLAALEAGS